MADAVVSDLAWIGTILRCGSSGADCFDRLPMYEGHLNRELDKSLARYDRMPDTRRQQKDGITGELPLPLRLTTRGQ